MKLFPNTIYVKVNMQQKQAVTVNGIKFAIVPNRGMYEQNARETNPVAVEVLGVGANVPLEVGDVVVLHHNMINDAIWQIDNRHVIPFDRWVMARVDANGWLVAMPGNIVGERINKIETVGEYALPQTATNQYTDRILTDDGKILGIRRWGDYEVCYNFNGEVRRKVVLWEEDVICEIKDYEEWTDKNGITWYYDKGRVAV